MATVKRSQLTSSLDFKRSQLISSFDFKRKQLNEDPWFFVLGFASTALYALSLALYRCLRNRSLLSPSLFEENLKTSAQEAAWDLGEQLPHSGGELRQWDDQLFFFSFFDRRPSCLSKYKNTRSLGALRALTSGVRPFGPA